MFARVVEVVEADMRVGQSFYRCTGKRVRSLPSHSASRKLLSPHRLSPSLWDTCRDACLQFVRQQANIKENADS